MFHEADVQLCPEQKKAFDNLSSGLKTASILRLWGGIGRGKTTILNKLRKQAGGVLLNMNDFVQASSRNHPLALEETVYQLALQTLKAHPIVMIDDVHLLDLFSAGCHFYPRGGYFNSIMMGLCTFALEANKKLIFSTTRDLAQAAEQRSYSFGIDRFKVEDYAALVSVWWGRKQAGGLDFEKIFRFAPKLNAHQLKAACRWLANAPAHTTNAFIEYLRSQRLASNVDLGEVQTVELRDLKGVDDVLRNLEINIVLPLENDELANSLKLRSKRGVLLYGPPGTGKTTIGRALAHRLRGKFFLIDGTFITGTSNFYGQISQVFESAKENSPSVIFIDDADSIFEDGEERGFYRYLLTMIDGLESESAGRVCVMMTAMNVGHLPPALVRSGRVELWLEMRLPDEHARTEILARHITSFPEDVGPLDLPRLIAATDGFTGADLKRTAEDGKAIYAYDRVKGLPVKSMTDYFLQAVEAVKENKQRYAAAEAQTALRTPSPMVALGRAFSFQAMRQDADDS